MIQEETLRSVGNRQYENPEGEIVDLISSDTNTVTVLTKVEEQKMDTLPFDPTDLTVSEIEERLGDEDYDWHQQALIGLLEIEEQNKNRKTARAMIEAHRDEFS